MEQQSKLYRMQSVQQAGTYDPVEGAVKAYRVNFVTASGITDYVTIPFSEYTPEKVQELVQAAALLHEKVLSIEGPNMVNGQPVGTHPWSQTG